MVKKIITFSYEHPLFVFFLLGVLLYLTYTTFPRMHLDALPDLSDPQVIILVRWEKPPKVIEDQITYPIITTLLSAPKVKAIRSVTDFGYSFIYILFQEGTDPYWSRTRVLEYLSQTLSQIPPGARVELGPDATGLGWVLQYVLLDPEGRYSPKEIRAFQEFTLKYILRSIEGVAEVATFGGYYPELTILLHPHKLLAQKVTIQEVIQAIREGNRESGAGLWEWNGREHMIRLVGYAKPNDLKKIVVKKGKDGVPILLNDLAKIQWGPRERRGAGDFNGEGDTVGGVIVMRYGENALKVIERVKKKIHEIEPSFPPGLKIEFTYDRSDLIHRTLKTLQEELIWEVLLVALVILLFLFHLPSSYLPIVMIPATVYLSFLPLLLSGVTINLMSLAGIAISIGVLVDGAIIAVENVYHRTSQYLEGTLKGDLKAIRLQAIEEVAGPLFYSLLVVAVSFLPIFALTDQEGRLFKPMAYSKTYTMIIASILTITLTPSFFSLWHRITPYWGEKPSLLNRIRNVFLVGRYRKELEHPITRPLSRIYEKILRRILPRGKWVILFSFLATLLGLWGYTRLGKEFLPPFDEGTLLFMPTTLPGVSMESALKIMIYQDRVLKSFPEVLSVHGKVGRAESSTDPAPISMLETVVVLKPHDQWRKKERWYHILPSVFHPFFRLFFPDRISTRELIEEMDRALRLPGVVHAWTFPIRNRIDMLTTGIRTPVGMKIYGPSLSTLQDLAVKAEGVLKDLPGVRSVIAERVMDGYYLDINPKRENLSRYGISLEALQMTLETLLSGMEITTLYEGRERYPVTIRVPREWKESWENLLSLPIVVKEGTFIPLSQVAEVEFHTGPAMIRNEKGFPVVYVFVDFAGGDLERFVELLKKEVKEKLSLPPGYFMEWTGQYESLQRVKERMKFLLPLTLAIIFLLIYLNTRSFFLTFTVLLAVPFSAVGAILLFHLLNYQVSVASWVGFIALMGLDAETGVFMLLYLEMAYKEKKKEKGKISQEDLEEAILYGASQRIRPKTMTVLTAWIGLLPIMLGTGIGSDITKRIAAPMVGGLLTSYLLELLVYPAIYKWYREREVRKNS